MSEAIRCVLFDLDGVLADYDRRTRAEVLGQQLGRDAAAVHDAIYASGVEDAADAGLLDVSAYLAALGRRLGCTVGADAWVHARRAATRVRPAMLQLASELGRRNITVAVLSNNSALMAEHWPTIVPPLAPLFHGRMFCSGQLRAAKPSPAAYLRCLDGLAVTPGATLFVDDSAVNVAGARQVGLAGHRFVDLPSLRQALAACGLV